jgi:uncharacterized protein YjiS (DUF1127 family)
MATRGTIATIRPLTGFGPVLTLRGVLAGLEARIAVRRSRHALLQLDERLLRDIGVTRGDAVAEAARSQLSLD